MINKKEEIRILCECVGSSILEAIPNIAGGPYKVGSDNQTDPKTLRKWKSRIVSLLS